MILSIFLNVSFFCFYPSPLSHTYMIVPDLENRVLFQKKLLFVNKQQNASNITIMFYIYLLNIRVDKCQRLYQKRMTNELNEKQIDNFRMIANYIRKRISLGVLCICNL